jgi:hypothetical protein
VVVRGLDQGRRAIAEVLASLEDAAMAVVAEAQGTGAIAEADQAAARALPVDQWRGTNDIGSIRRSR